MRKYKITFNKPYGTIATVEQECIAASFKPVPGTDAGVLFFDKDGHAISYYTKVDKVNQLIG